jgi:hypothetical protein
MRGAIPLTPNTPSSHAEGQFHLNLDTKYRPVPFRNVETVDLNATSTVFGKQICFACYNFRTLPKLPSKCLTDLHPHMYETNDIEHYSRVPTNGGG